MFNKNFLLLILLLLKTILSLKPTDLCNKIQEECKGSYDHNQKYQVKCERFKCQGKYNFQCDFNKCALRIVQELFMNGRLVTSALMDFTVLHKKLFR